MSSKRKRIAAMVERHQGHKLGRHYVGFVECFNRGLFYEAHEVLEHVWLPDKHGPNGAFYKGLIQLAGAFVHLQKQRPQPATALFKLALANLEKYPRVHDDLNLDAVRSMIQHWLAALERKELAGNLPAAVGAPKLELEFR